jgi:hypothetical protein
MLSTWLSNNPLPLQMACPSQQLSISSFYHFFFCGREARQKGDDCSGLNEMKAGVMHLK